jgi:integrase
MFTQACRWGWRDTNPAQWAEPPQAEHLVPVVPTEVMALIDEANSSRRPEKARAMFLAATTGMRRAEICALRRDRDIDWDRAMVTVNRSIVVLPKKPPAEIPTKNRRSRPVALDDLSLSMLRDQRDFIEARAAEAEVDLVDDPYLFTDEADGSAPWKPDSVTRFFTRVRGRVGFDHINFHDLRKFMETYAQDLGFAPAAVAMRAGHDPSVMSRHYTGRIEEADRALASAVAALISPTTE